MWFKRVLVASTIVCTTLLTGCGLWQLSTDKIEQTLSTKVFKKKGSSQDVSVECPSYVAKKAGTEFDCSISGGAFQSVKVTLKKDDGSQIGFSASSGSDEFGSKTSGQITVR